MRARLVSVLTVSLAIAGLAATSGGASAVVRTGLVGQVRGGRSARASGPRIGFALPASSVVTGKPFLIDVAVVPRRPRERLVLERRGDRRWRSLAVAATNREGLATFQVRPQPVGTLTLRVIASATATSPELKSGTASLVVEPIYGVGDLAEGSSGAAVLALQQRLSELGYWLGTPNGVFGDATQQAVYALQKAAKIDPTGVVNGATAQALAAGALPTARSTTGNVIEVDLEDDLLLFVDNGVVEHILNTSTGGGYTYYEDGTTQVATTPRGVFSIQSAVDGLVTDSLGQLWRPRFFYEGYAIHGDGFVPSYPASHGCVRVSNEAIDWIWANNLASIGEEVWVY